MRQIGASPGGGTASGRDWTKGNIFRNLVLLAAPMVGSNILNISGPTIDMIWVGKLGPVAIAGVGVAGMGVQLMMSAMMGLMTGARAMVARFVGAGDIAGANHVARQAFILSASYAILVAAVGIFFAETILVLFGLEADVVAQGAAYMRIMFVGAAFMSFRMMAEGVMQASGDAMAPMKIAVIFRLFHVVLAPFLIFGWWIFPRLGVSGAALTNVISQSLGMFLVLQLLFSGRTRLRVNFTNLRLDFNIIWRMVKIGLPASVMGIQWTIGYVVLTWIMVSFGTLAVAAHTVSQRVEMILFMPGMGLGMAAGVLAGQNLGAGQPGRAERSGWLAAGMVEAIMLAGVVVIWLWAEGIVGIFNTEPGLVQLASAFLKIAIIGYAVMGLAAVFMQCLSGVGDTVPPMIASMLMIWLVQLPLAYFLPRVTDLGVYGVRWAMVISMFLGAIVFIAYFRMGRWKRKKV